MNVENFGWTIKKLTKLKDKIDPKPQYQRGEVWNEPKKQLLIDSILNKYDIPKIYLRHVKGQGIFDYEVADGQQRLMAIWRFLDDEYPLARSAHGASWSGKKFSQLTHVEQRQILSFDLITAIVYNATGEEIRSLFARLQKGEKLTPPELRNSIPSVLGNIIRAMAETHAFFRYCRFPDTRFAHDNLVTHAFALELSGTEQDLKAPSFADMYETYAGGVDVAVPREVSKTLHFMRQMEARNGGCIATKWGFVDLYGLISLAGAGGTSAAELSDAYVRFEHARQRALPNIKHLLTGRKKDRDLYDYITAFKESGGLAENVTKRIEVLSRKLLGKKIKI